MSQICIANDGNCDLPVHPAVSTSSVDRCHIEGQVWLEQFGDRHRLIGKAL